MIISCTTAVRCIPGQESSTTNVGYMEGLLTYTLICQMTQKKRNPDTTGKARIMTDVTSTADTLVSQVTPLLGITPRESTQLRSMNTSNNVEEILGTRAFQRYVVTPIQTFARSWFL